MKTDLKPITFTVNGQQGYANEASDKYRDSALTVSWMLRCFIGSIREAYREGSPRLLEARRVVNDILTQVQPQMAAADFEELQREMQFYMEPK